MACVVLRPISSARRATVELGGNRQASRWMVCIGQTKDLPPLSER